MSLIVAPTLALQAYVRRREYAADDQTVAVLDDLLRWHMRLGKSSVRTNRAGSCSRGYSRIDSALNAHGWSECLRVVHRLTNALSVFEKPQPPLERT